MSNNLLASPAADELSRSARITMTVTCRPLKEWYWTWSPRNNAMCVTSYMLMTWTEEMQTTLSTSQNNSRQSNAQYLQVELDRSLEESKMSDCSVCQLVLRRSSNLASTGCHGRMHSDQLCQVYRLNSKCQINPMQICNVIQCLRQSHT